MIIDDKKTVELSAILKNAKKGNSGAFTEIYNLYFKKIFNFIYFRVSHKETAEDLTEEVFLKLLNKISGLKDEKAFEGWLFMIARRIVIDHYRSQKIQVSLEEVENSLSYESNVLDVLQLESEQKSLLKKIKQLPKDQETVIKLKFFEQLSYEAIAGVMNKSQGAIRVILHRAITNLKNGQE